MRNGLFVTFEGPEGSGKSTQIKRTRAYLRNEGYDVLTLREPGGNEVGERIRSVLLDPSLDAMCIETELLLYLAARAQIVREQIVPALKEGKVVICDRYEDSTVAYQGYGRGISLQKIKQLNQFAREKIVPDVTILLDLPPEKGFRRGGRRDRMEKQTMRFHRRVRKGFLKIAESNKRRVHKMNALSSRDLITSRICKVLNGVLGE